MKLKLVLLLTLNLISCAQNPTPPDVTWWGVYTAIPDPGFYSVDSLGNKSDKPFGDPSMNGAQCLQPDDFLKERLFRNDLEAQGLSK